MKMLNINLSFFSTMILEKLPIKDCEKKFLEKLSPNKVLEYRYSRGKLRSFLSPILKIPPLEIPLIAPPGKPPKLEDGLGFVSISHCKDALLLGWSKYPVGVDIEHCYRKINAENIIKNFYSKLEQNEAKKYFGEELRRRCLDLWVIKESAIKSTSGSIFRDLFNWEYSKSDNIVNNKKIDLKKRIFLKELDGYKIGIAYDLRIKDRNFFISKI